MKRNLERVLEIELNTNNFNLEFIKNDEGNFIANLIDNSDGTIVPFNIKSWRDFLLVVTMVDVLIYEAETGNEASEKHVFNCFEFHKLKLKYFLNDELEEVGELAA